MQQPELEVISIKSLTRLTAFGDSLRDIKVQISSLKHVSVGSQYSDRPHKQEILKGYKKSGHQRMRNAGLCPL